MSDKLNLGAKTPTVKEQGNAASLKNNPPAVVNGVSDSLVAQTEIERGEKDEATQALETELENQAAAKSIVLDAKGTQYTSHPIENYRIGRFRFTKGLLRLDGKDAEEFDKLLAAQPPQDQARVRKLDVAAAEAIVRERLANQRPGATKSFDSSIGERAEKKVGTGALGDGVEGFANTAQTDMNRPVDPETGEPLKAGE